MKVSTLQQYIRSLAIPLQASGVAAKFTTDLEQTCNALDPFSDMDFPWLSELLKQADEYRRTKILPVGTTRKRAPAAKDGYVKSVKTVKRRGDPAVVADLAQRVRALEEKAAAPETSDQEIQDGLVALRLDDVKKDDLVGTAQELGCPGKSDTNKGEAIRMIRRVVLQRKESHTMAFA